jgi:hypothetical protein
MEASSTPSPPKASTALPRTLCLLILILMASAAIYGAGIALRYFGRIGV